MISAEQAMGRIQDAWNDPKANAQAVINAVGEALRLAGYETKY